MRDDSMLQVISDGTIKWDGGVMFGSVPKMVWESYFPSDRLNRVRLGLNCLLLKNGQHCILVDTGVGSKVTERQKQVYGLGPSRLLRELRRRGVSPRDVTDVILTHLQFDHCGGSTRLDRRGSAVPSFPHATYYVQRAAWDEATQPSERTRDVHVAEDFEPLWEGGRVTLLEGDGEVVPGVWVRTIDSAAPGHQMVFLRYGGEQVAFLGDLVPTAQHVTLGCLTALARHPDEALRARQQILDEAERGGWLLILAHGLDIKAGYLCRKDNQRQFRPVEL